MMKRWTALMLAALLLLCSACSPADPGEPDRSTLSPGPDSSQVQSSPEPTEDPEEEPEQDPFDPDPPPAWEEGRTLDVAMPDSYNGLELPIQGATGYPSVELPLWAAVEDAQAAAEAVEAWELAQEEALLAQEQDQPDQPEAGAADPAAGQQTGTGETPAQAPEENPTQSGQTAPQARTLPAEGEPSQQAPAPETNPAAGPAGDPNSEPAAEPAAEPSAEPAGQDPLPGGEDSEPSPPAEGETPPQEGEPVLPGEEEPEAPTLSDGSITLLPPGTPFTVLQEEGDWWYILVEADYYEDEEETILAHGELNGWVEHRYCMVNLPDVIPSILYDATNSYSSRFISCGRAIPDITGEAFYPSRTYNPRLNRYEFMMPVLYSMAPKLCAAQRAALAEGNCLVLYEGFRPLDLQSKVYRAMSALAISDPEVRAAVSESPWNITWFIAGGTANHQQGYAVDMGLANVTSISEHYANGYRYLRVVTFDQYEMPTPIHELSRAAATFTAPVAIFSNTAWKQAELASSMNDPALGLQHYCTGAGLTPLASEWWHFNDLESYFRVEDNLGMGDFTITSIRSVLPS